MSTTSPVAGWINVACPSCGDAAGTEVFTARNMRYGIDVTATVVACPGCGLMRTNPQPDDDTIASLYKAGEYYTHDTAESQGASDSSAVAERVREAKAKAHTTARRLMISGPAARLRAQVEARTDLRRFTRRFAIEEFGLERGQSVLDIGCGGGQVLEIIKAMGIDTVGVEPDPTARAAAERRGITIIDSLEGCTQRFDRIILRHVLEHVPGPVDILTEARTFLKPGGRIMIAVPNANAAQADAFGHYWEGWDLPRHRWHFSADTLEDLCNRAGLSLQHIRSVELDAFAIASHEHREQQGVEAVSYSPSGYLAIEDAMRGAELIAICMATETGQ